MSRELPILCAAPVVRAILDGRQTQDRRPVKPQPPPSHTLHTCWHQSWKQSGRVKASWEYWAGPVYNARPAVASCGSHVAVAPWSPGDVLYVRETWRSVGWRPENGHWIEYDADGLKVWREAPAGTLSIDVVDERRPDRWRPSIHMPKWAARIRLRVLSVGVERVNAISEEDARAEGIEPNFTQPLGDHPGPRPDGLWRSRWVDGRHNARDHRDRHGYWPVFPTAREAFGELWDSLYGAGGFDRGDWCWVTRFERVVP